MRVSVAPGHLSRRAIFIAAGLLAAIMILGTITALVLYRNAALASGEWHLKNAALALAAHARQGLLTVDIALRATAEEYSQQVSTGALSEEAFHRRMRQRAAELPQLSSLQVITPDGRLVAHSELFPAPPIDFSDRDYFAAQRQSQDRGSYFGVPVRERVSQAWTQPMSRRISNADGQFLGVATAAVDILYFHDVYRALELGPAGHVFLFRRDGVLLTSFPQNEARLGSSFKAHLLFTALGGAPTGVLRTAGIMDDQPRLIAYHSVPDYPLVAVVASSVNYVLQEWRQQSLYAAGGAVVAIAIILAAALLLLRQVRRSEDLAVEVTASEQRLNAIIGSAMDAVITVDENQDIVLFNAAAERIFGCPSLEAVGGPLDRFLPQRFRAAHRAHVERFGQTGVTMRRMGENIVLSGLRADGEEFPIDASISQVVVGGHRFYTVILRDITERQRAAAQLAESHHELRELYGAMNEVREAERIRIARELHDELAQWLTALKMDVSWIASRLPRDETRLLDKTARMKEVVDTTVAAVRRIASDLRPVMIDDLGLVPAIEHLLHDFSQRTGITISLDTSTDRVEFHDPVATAVYRMVQEALTNVARHANATRVEVRMALNGEQLQVMVRDNGRGIDEAGLRRRKSYGVLGIRERAQTLGGIARIYRADEGGTIVEITIPMRAQERAESVA
ncbi:MAG: PAS domain S-box protein [Betaproteobacteria bacterium]